MEAKNIILVRTYSYTHTSTYTYIWRTLYPRFYHTMLSVNGSKPTIVDNCFGTFGPRYLLIDLHFLLGTSGLVVACQSDRHIVCVALNIEQLPAFTLFLVMIRKEKNIWSRSTLAILMSYLLFLSWLLNVFTRTDLCMRWLKTRPWYRGEKQRRNNVKGHFISENVCVVSTMFVLDRVIFFHCVSTLTRRTICLSNNTFPAVAKSCKNLNFFFFFLHLTLRPRGSRCCGECAAVSVAIEHNEKNNTQYKEWAQSLFPPLASERSPRGRLPGSRHPWLHKVCMKVTFDPPPISPQRWWTHRFSLFSSLEKCYVTS